MSNKIHDSTIGPIRSGGTKVSILIGPLEKGPGIVLLNSLFPHRLVEGGGTVVVILIHGSVSV